MPEVFSPTRHSVLANSATAAAVSFFHGQPILANERTAVRTFSIDIREEQLVDLRRRITAARWPDRETVGDQSQGVWLAMMQDLARAMVELRDGLTPLQACSLSGWLGTDEDAPLVGETCRGLGGIALGIEWQAPVSKRPPTAHDGDRLLTQHAPTPVAGRSHIHDILKYQLRRSGG